MDKVEHVKINSEFAMTRAELDKDINASIQMMKPKSLPKPTHAICCKCGKRRPTSLMAVVGLDCYECRGCLYA